MGFSSRAKLSDSAVKEAVSHLKKGGVIAYPTDTVYGLGADATKAKAIMKVYEVKGRNYRKPLSIAVDSQSMLKKYANIGKKENALIKEFGKARLFPGPTTLLLRKKRLPSILTNKKTTIGIRIPENKLCINIVRMFGKPITSTSANLSGRKAARNYKNLQKEILKNVDFVVKGKCIHRKESTIIDVSRMKIVRKGARWKAVEKILRTLKL